MTQLLSWHRVGQRVVYLGSPPGEERNPHFWGPQLSVGAVYVVKLVELLESVTLFALCDMPAVPEHASWGVVPDWLWSAASFRPIRETSIDQFRGLLSPTDADRQRLIHEAADAADREHADA